MHNIIEIIKIMSQQKCKLVTIDYVLGKLQNNKTPDNRLEVYKALKEQIFSKPSHETLADFEEGWETLKLDDPQGYQEEYDKFIQLCLEFELCEPGQRVRDHLGAKPISLETKFLVRPKKEEDDLVTKN